MLGGAPRVGVTGVRGESMVVFFAAGGFLAVRVAPQWLRRRDNNVSSCRLDASAFCRLLARETAHSVVGRLGLSA